MDFQLHNNIAVFAFDDGKANVIGHAFMDALIDGLDRAEREAKAVVITGRTGLLSGGFDLKETGKGVDAARAVMKKGSNMFYRLFAHPQPLVIACTGHAIAAGAFLLLTADYRIGTAGEFRIGLNETSIGATFPVFGVQLAKARLNPAYLTRSFVHSEAFAPDEAVAAGFLDEVRSSGSALATALEVAGRLAKLPAKAYAGNKLDIRRPAIDAIRASL